MDHFVTVGHLKCTVKTIWMKSFGGQTGVRSNPLEPHQPTGLTLIRAGWARLLPQRQRSRRFTVKSSTHCLQAHLSSVQSMVWTYPLTPVKSGDAIAPPAPPSPPVPTPMIWPWCDARWPCVSYYYIHYIHSIMKTNPRNYLEQLNLTGTVSKVFNLVQNYGGTIPKEHNSYVNSTHKWDETTACHCSNIEYLYKT